MEKNVRVGVAVLVCRDGEYLLIKRSGELGTDTWAPPGGKLDLNEDIMVCGLREMKEEVGDIVVSEPIFFGVTNDIFEKEQQHYITIWLTVDYISGEPEIKEPTKHSEIGWFHQDDVQELNLFLPFFNFTNGKYLY